VVMRYYFLFILFYLQLKGVRAEFFSSPPEVRYIFNNDSTFF
jgi:hypothetical protein